MIDNLHYGYAWQDAANEKDLLANRLRGVRDLNQHRNAAGASLSSLPAVSNPAELSLYGTAAANLARNNFTSQDVANQLADDNYAYDEIGNLTADQADGARLTWTVYGKVATVQRTTPTAVITITYGYDASGNRTSKQVETRTLATDARTTVNTYYVRDAQGNVLSVYDNNGGSLSQKELYLYGSSRLGVARFNAARDAVPSGLYTRSLNIREYELTDHLGNVRVVIGDGRESPLRAALKSYYNYYAFGMAMPGMSAPALGYRYGYNGKEQDRDLTGYDFGARLYDEKIARWRSVDPSAHKFPWQSPYAAIDNNPILKNDPTGQSGEVTIDKQSKIITVSANLVFYGESASPELAKQTALDIQNLWNGANGKVKIDGVEYKVQFNVTSEYRDTKGPIDAIAFFFEKGLNDAVKNNYIEVKSRVDGGVSNMRQGGNEGIFQLDNINGTGTTTEAHEFGHSLGLWPGTLDGHPKESDLIGKGQPGIMYPRGTKVDPQYQYDPKAKPGEKNGTLNPNKRKVMQADIDALGLDGLKYDGKGKANLGTSSSSW